MTNPYPSDRLARAQAQDAKLVALDRHRTMDLSAMALVIREVDSEQGFLLLGFGSVFAYAFDRFGWGGRKTEALLWLVKRLDALPLVREAFARGELLWTKAVLVVRAAEREPENEERWLEVAKVLNNKQLAKLVRRRGAEEGDEEPEKIGRMMKWTPEQDAWIQGILRALRSEGLEVDLAGALAEVARRVLQGGGAGVGSSAFRVVLEHCEVCKRTVEPKEVEVEISSETAELLLCDAEVQDASEPETVKRTVPVRLKNRILARSKGRCEVPGCGHRTYVEIHHHKGWRGGHDTDHMSLICSAHHHAVHDGLLRIRGSWATGIQFTLANGELILFPSLESLLPAPLPPPKPTKSKNQTLAVKALVKMELKVREARELVKRALTEHPELTDASAGELAGAAFVLI